MPQYDFVDAFGDNIEAWSVNVTHHERICYLVLHTTTVSYLVIYSVFTSTHQPRQYDYDPDHRRWNQWRARQPSK